MKAQKKVLITNITSAIESTISPAGEQPKKVIKAVEKTAKKLATKLMKNVKNKKSKTSVKTEKLTKNKAVQRDLQAK